MNATELLAALRARGVELVADGDRLRYRPRTAVPPDLRAAMVTLKPAILRLLSEECRAQAGAEPDGTAADPTAKTDGNTVGDGTETSATIGENPDAGRAETSATPAENIVVNNAYDDSRGWELARQSWELTRRVAAFCEQIDEWARAGRPGVPLLVLPDAPPPRAGTCRSCGTAVAGGRWWRCQTCRPAVELVLGLAPLEEGAP